MKHLIAFALSACALLPLHAQDEATANGVVSIDDNRALTVRSNNGSFEFKPYLMVQTHGAFNWYDDEGLDKAYNQDNVANSGFAMPYAVLGFTGKAYDKVTYNLSINAAASGANVLQQAWFDVKVNNDFGLRAGKFKTPFAHAYLTTLGETLLPMLPTSLTAPVILPYSLNAVTPSMATGFDLGVEAHGLFAVGKESKLGYQLGVFQRQRLRHERRHEDLLRRLAHSLVALRRSPHLSALGRDARHAGKSETAQCAKNARRTQRKPQCRE